MSIPVVDRPAHHPAQGSGIGRWSTAALLLLTCFGLLIRLRWLGELVDDDPPYQLLRVQALLTRPFSWSMIAGRDPLVAHPLGAIPHWPWGFQFLLAILARPFAGSAPSPDHLVRVCSVIVACFGSAIVPVSYALGRCLWADVDREGSRRLGLIAAGLAAILPGYYDYSIAPRVDHHVLEPILLGLMVLGPLAPVRRGRPALALCGGLAGGLALAVAPAAPPFVLLAEALLGAALLFTPGRAVLAVHHALGVLAGVALALLASPYPREWVFYSPSLLHLTLIAVLGAGLCASARVARTWPPRAALGTGVLAAALLLSALLVLVPALRHALLNGVFYATTGKIGPPTEEAGALYADPAWGISLLTFLSPLAPVGAALLLLPSRRPEARAVGILTLLVLALAIGKLRFVAISTPFLAVAIAVALVALSGWVTRQLAARGRPPALGPLTVGAAALLLLLPTADKLIKVAPFSERYAILNRVADALARAPRQQGDGVLAPWDYGHIIQWRAGLPTLCDNFFGAPEHDEALLACARLFYSTDPDESDALLRRYKVRYLIIAPPSRDSIRNDLKMLGRDPASILRPDGRLAPGFRDTLVGRLGLWGSRARAGERGPLGTVLRTRVSLDDARGRPRAEVLIFERPPGP